MILLANVTLGETQTEDRPLVLLTFTNTELSFFFLIPLPYKITSKSKCSHSFILFRVAIHLNDIFLSVF